MDGGHNELVLRKTLMTEPGFRLIHDIGLLDGSETAYYLFRSYKVVAIDANPLMVEKAKPRFAQEIEAKRLKLLNVWISGTPGATAFCVFDAGWSSFDKTLASRGGTAPGPISVSVLPFSQLLTENGYPHYLKVDNEGSGRSSVSALRGSQMPKLISVNAECAGGHWQVT